MDKFIRAIAVLLISAYLAQVTYAQFNVSGPGFLPDENGTNLDDPKPKKGTSKVAGGALIKSCADCPEMVVIPAGSFVMGSNKSSDEQPTHSVNLRSFLMGKTEVIQEQWEAVMGYNPSKNKGRTLPVETYLGITFNSSLSISIKEPDKSTVFPAKPNGNMPQGLERPQTGVLATMSPS